MTDKQSAKQQSSNKPFFTDAEIDQLILAVCSGASGGTEEEAAVFLEWAELVRVNEGLLSLALEGKLSISIGPDRAPRFFPRTTPGTA